MCILSTECEWCSPSISFVSPAFVCNGKCSDGSSGPSHPALWNFSLCTDSLVFINGLRRILMKTSAALSPCLTALLFLVLMSIDPAASPNSDFCLLCEDPLLCLEFPFLSRRHPEILQAAARASLPCSNHSLSLPVAQYLKTVVSHAFSSVLVVYRGRISLPSIALWWLQMEARPFKG